MWSRRGACFLCGIHEFSMSLRTASVINSKRVVVVVVVVVVVADGMYDECLCR